MKNKLASLIAILMIASCSSTPESKVVEVQPEPVVVEPKIVEFVELPPEENIEFYSIPAEEIATSDIKPFVVYFDTDKYNIRADAAKTLNEKVLPEVANVKTKKVVIEAHCDERASNAYNQKLSEKRAHAVKKFLVKNGIKSSIIKTIGYGETKPVAKGHDEDSWSKNRRAVTIVIKR
jgi:peptidoglycan-associated lipoprotein